jgi:hypothetical protein
MTGPLITDRTIHTNRPDMAILGKIIREAYLIDATIRNSHNLHSTITEKQQKYTDLKEELTRIWQLKAVYITLLVLSTMGIIPNKITHKFKTA